MRVLHLAPIFFDKDVRLGGAERYAYELAQAMASKVETEFVSFSSNAKTYPVGPLAVRLLKRWGSVDRSQINPWPIGVAACIRRADVVQCYHRRTVLTDWAIGLGRRWRKPVFVTDLGGAARCTFSDVFNLDRWVTGFLLPSQDCVSYFRYRGERVHVVYGGVDVARFSPQGTPYDPQRVLFVGRNIPPKGIEYLIDAVTPQEQLSIVGQVLLPSYRAQLEERARGKAVRFISDLSDEDLVQAYGQSLVTVLPSITRMEKLGLVLLESMACGTPVICCRMGGMPEAVRDGETGFVVPPQDAGAIAEKIAWLQTHPQERRRMGERARQWVLERFSWDRIADRHVGIYRDALGKGTA